MKTNELLANIKVASPCTARWGHMAGNDRARYCAQCQKHVYNLSTLTAEEAAALIRDREGSLCARFYQRADGTVLTSDCPVGAGQIRVRFRRLFGAAAALLLLGITVPLIARPPHREELPRARARVYRAWDAALVTIKSWLGHSPAPTMILGEICVAPSPGNTPANPPPKSSPPN